MRIVKGGMVLRSIAPNQYTVKDEPAVGLQIQQMPLRLTKDALYQILKLNKIPFNRNDKKKTLEAQLHQLYALHPTQSSKHIIYEKGKAKLKPRVQSEIPELAYEKLYRAKPIPKRRNPMHRGITVDAPSPAIFQANLSEPVRVPPPLPPRPKVVDLDEPPPKPPRPAYPLKPPRPVIRRRKSFQGFEL